MKRTRLNVNRLACQAAMLVALSMQDAVAATPSVTATAGDHPTGVVSGSGTVTGTATSVPDRRSGSVRSGGPNSHGSGISSHPGSLCQVGYWGIQDGMLQCVNPTLPIVAGFGSKAVDVRFQMPSPADPYIIPLIRLSGDAGTSIRVDLYDAVGSTASSTATCFISAPDRPCHMGSATGPGYAASLHTTPKLKDGASVRQYADYLVTTASSVRGFGTEGHSYADSYYVATVVLDPTGTIKIYVAGLFAQLSSPTSGNLVGPIVGQGSISSSYVASISTSAVYTFTGWFK